MKIGFIGGGNMGGAIIKGIIASGTADAADISVSDKNADALCALKTEYGVYTTDDNTEVVRVSDVVFLCVKPQILYGVIDEIKDVTDEDTLIISIAAGQAIADIENAFGKKIKLIRVMPNTPALVGEGMAALSPNNNVTDNDIKTAVGVMGSLGKAEIVPEHLMDAVTAVSGSSPAYVFMMIEAMADAAVREGMPRKQAYTFAAQAVMGSAKMALETDSHVAELKDMVCSPAGTTIEAVAALEKNGFRNAIMEAMHECAEMSRRMGRK